MGFPSWQDDHNEPIDFRVSLQLTLELTNRISCFLLVHTLCRADTEISLYWVWNVYDPLTRRTELEDAEVEIQALDLEIIVL
jgi:hypothetical protein